MNARISQYGDELPIQFSMPETSSQGRLLKHSASADGNVSLFTPEGQVLFVPSSFLSKPNPKVNQTG